MIGQKIKERRKALQVTQSMIAEFLGLDQSAVSRIEREKQQLTPYQLFELSKLLKMNVDEFFEGAV